MKKVIVVLLTYLVGIIMLSVCYQQGVLPVWVYKADLLYKSLWVGVLGGLMYLFRAVYINACVKQRWDAKWELWYFIRPIVSGISGLLTYFILKAGLVALDANGSAGKGDFGFLAFSFIAGLNVDRFVKKIESIAQSLWGIEASRMNSEDKDNF